MSNIAELRPSGPDESRLADLLDVFPAAVYMTDAEGRVTFFNAAAEALAGRTPQIGVDQWCVTWKLYTRDGELLPLSECPMAQTLKTGEAIRGVEVIAEQPNGARVPVMPFPTPLRDATGALVGAVNMLVDISPLKRAEAAAARRADQQAALYRFTDRLYRSERIDDIYEAALDAILSALDCSRASILLFDANDVMSFVASRGLSDAYCAAVNGHSPWKRGDADPAPITIADVAAADDLDALKPVILGEGIGSLAFIPLIENGQVMGKFMAYHDEAHDFSEEEIDLAVNIARQLGFAVERSRARERSRLMFEHAGVGMVLVYDRHRIAQANSAYVEITGRSQAEMAGASCLDYTYPDDVPANVAAIETLERSGGPVSFEKRVVRPDGSIVWTRVTISNVSNGQVLAVVEDVTARHAAENQRTLLINELNHRVKNTLATVQSLAAQTLRSTERSADARVLFEARLAALSRAHNLLTRQNWEGASLAEVVGLAITPFRMNNERFVVSGPSVRLSPKQAVALAIAINELATNAVKYGALSNADGRVNIEWVLVDVEGRPGFELKWAETGGPPVATPSRTGFGMRLLRRNLSDDLGGETAVDFDAGGVLVKMSSPIASAKELRPD